MTKRVEIDGKFYRMRRGKLVEIPTRWVGRVTTPQTINRRNSKLKAKARRELKRDNPRSSMADNWNFDI